MIFGYIFNQFSFAAFLSFLVIFITLATYIEYFNYGEEEYDVRTEFDALPEFVFNVFGEY